MKWIALILLVVGVALIIQASRRNLWARVDDGSLFGMTFLGAISASIGAAWLVVLVFLSL